MEQTVELAVCSGEAGSSGNGAEDATSAAATAVGKSVGEARPLLFANHSASTESKLAVSSDETGSVGPGANDTVSVAATVVAKSVERARPPGVGKYRARTESELVDKTPTHNTHLCSTVCSQARNAHTTRLAQVTRIALSSLCA